jgi:cell division protein FtsW (lipid II flippase)
MSEKRHPGITMHKLTFGSGFVGLLFTVGCSLIFVLGFPTLWYFVAFSAVLGIAVAIILRASSRRHSERMKPFSIFPAPLETKNSVGPQPDQRRRFPHDHPRLCVT